MARLLVLLLLFVAINAIPSPAIPQDIVVDPSDLSAEKINEALVKKGKGWLKGQAKAAGKDWIFESGQSETMQAILEEARRRSEGDDKNVRANCKGAVMGKVSTILTNLGYKTNVQAGGKKMFETATKMGSLASGFGGAVAEGGGLNWVIGQYTDAAAGKAKDSVFDAIKKLFIDEKQPQFEIYEHDGTVGKCEYKLRAVWDIVHGTYSVYISGDCHCEPAGNTGIAPQRLGKWWITFKGHLKVTFDKPTKTVKWVVLPVDSDGMNLDAQCDCSTRELGQPFAEKPQACPPPAGAPLSPEERAKIEAQIEEKTQALEEEEGQVRELSGQLAGATSQGDQKAINEIKEKSRQSEAKQTKLKKDIADLKKRLSSAGAAPPPAAPGKTNSGVSLPLNPFASRILSVHNAERAAVGSPPLSWNPTLAEHAQAYANELARSGQLTHAPRGGRGIERENLSQGNRWWTTDQMMQNWLREKSHFVGGTFPNVSDTGDWADVGHYSQIVWSRTTDLGCGEARGSVFNWLVCRYSPGGNKDGQLVVAPPPVEISAPPCPEDRDM